MITDVHEVEDLKSENLELKLSAIRKDVSTLKIDLHRHLDMILEQTSKTNGSVAKAMERIYILERQESKVKLDELKCQFEQYKSDTAFWHLIAKNRWIAGLIAFTMYAFTIKEFRDLIFSIFKLA